MSDFWRAVSGAVITWCWVFVGHSVHDRPWLLLIPAASTLVHFIGAYALSSKVRP